MPDNHTTERRANRRYPVELRLQYKLIAKGGIQRIGFGRTINISSRGVLFESEDAMPASGRIELILNWPALLHGVCALKVIMRGRILRTQVKTVALKTEFREFRTAGVSALREPPAIH
jgi:hypothetical protein